MAQYPFMGPLSLQLQFAFILDFCMSIKLVYNCFYILLFGYIAT